MLPQRAQRVSGSAAGWTHVGAGAGGPPAHPSPCSRASPRRNAAGASAAGLMQFKTKQYKFYAIRFLYDGPKTSRLI